MKRLLARALLWTTLESLCVTLVALSTILVYAIFLTPAELGRGAFAVSLVQLLIVPTESICTTALIQRRTCEEIDYRTALTSSVVIAMVFIVLSFPFAQLFARVVEDGAVVAMLPATALGLLFSALNVPIVARHRREFDFKPLAVRIILGRTFGALAGIAAAISGAGAWALVAQQLVYMGLTYLLLRLHDRRGTPLGFSRQSFHQLIRVGLSPAAGYLLTIAAPKLFVIAIATTFGSAAAGFANLAFRAIDAARDVISAAVGQLLLPLVSKAERETGKGSEISLTGTSLVCATTFPIFWGGAICAPEVVTLFFGPEWQQAVPLFAAHSLTMSYTFALIVIATRMTAIGRPNGMLPGLAAQSLIVICGAFLAGAASFGSSAVLIAAIWASRLLVALPLDLFFIHREFREQFTSFLHRLARYSAHSFAMVAVVATVDALTGPYVSLPERLALKVMIGAVVIAALYLLLERPILREVQQLLALGLSRKDRTEA